MDAFEYRTSQEFMAVYKILGELQERIDSLLVEVDDLRNNTTDEMLGLRSDMECLEDNMLEGRNLK